MTKILITRHGETQWNKEGRMQGQLDSDLTDLGMKQARWLGESLKDVPIDVIISSSSGRTVATAELIRGDREIEIIKQDDIREMCFGSWEGKLHTQVETIAKEARHKLWNAPEDYQSEDGEDFYELIERVGCALENIISIYEGKTVLIVTHGIVLKTLITYIQEKDVKDLWAGEFMYSTCLNVLEIEGDKREFTVLGDVSHYQEDIKLNH